MLQGKAGHKEGAICLSRFEKEWTFAAATTKGEGRLRASKNFSAYIPLKTAVAPLPL